jgi:hypothetical protein
MAPGRRGPGEINLHTVEQDKNKFSNLEECRDDLGEWTDKEATEDCEDEGSTLTRGKTYYLYVLADIIVPVTRCLFVAP